MRKLVLLIAAVSFACTTDQRTDADVERWEAQAANITIIRDDWGVPHVYGKTDADAVFGAMYAQAEDDFNRVETNYLTSLGRTAEADGERAIWSDLRQKLFIDPDSLRAQYERSPEWLQALMTAWADGLNYYLHTHSGTTPRVITRFEPWMALSFTEGSIGGDIERVSLRGLEEFYDGDATSEIALEAIDEFAEPRGSNGIAIAPANTANGHALLLINPHTSFFFRHEAQMVSEEGLNAYGALTWGQFFIYQGFNEKAGWMHTSTGADNIDEFAETVVRRDSAWFYRYGSEERPLVASRITVPFRSDTGMAQREFTVYRTHHGPIVRAADGKWVSVSLMQDPIDALTQSYIRTKASNLAEYRESMELHTNSSNNTLFADAEGTIAYLHSNFVPKRDPALDWTRPVDGSVPANDWQGVHTFDESPNVVNPPNGWVQNTNNWPYSAAGPNSPKQAEYPSYFDRAGENARGVHAVRALTGRTAMTIDSLIAVAYGTSMPAFEELIPPLLRSYDRLPAANPLKARMAEQIDSLRAWNHRWGVGSVSTSLAIFWADTLQRRIAAEASRAGMSSHDFAVRRATDAQRVEALAAASDKLAADFGDWRTPWGEINRFQRRTGDIVQQFDDSAPSTAVGFPSGRWGTLASFGARPYEGTKRWYGTSGNSFVAVVEFGDSVRARAVTAGGLNNDPSSPHFNDQAERYATGNLRPVYFYRSQLEGHIEREYRPGQR